ncbi:MAG: hypothetical protein HS132_00410 [Planctomycetia bacterium]|nr:hypothetical protein [Planctomycetia bacterium]
MEVDVGSGLRFRKGMDGTVPGFERKVLLTILGMRFMKKARAASISRCRMTVDWGIVSP